MAPIHASYLSERAIFQCFVKWSFLNTYLRIMTYWFDKIAGLYNIIKSFIYYFLPRLLTLLRFFRSVCIFFFHFAKMIAEFTGEKFSVL